MYDEKYQSNFPNSNYLSNLNNLNGTNQSIHLNRLPTLGEILANKSKSPVDLFTFYQFMKDVEGKVDYLDFWFDLINHLNLCKHYVKGLRDSIVRQSGTFSHHNNNRLSQSHQSGAYTNDTLDLQQQSQQSQQSQQQPQAQQQQSQQQSQQRFSAPRNAMHRSSDSPSIPSNRQSSGARPISETSQKHKSLSSSILLDLIINDNILEENDSHRLSAFLRGDISLDNIDPKLKELIEQYNAETDAENRYSNEPLQSPLSPAFQTSARSSASLGSRSNNPFLPQQPSPKLKHSQRQEKRVSSQSHLIDQYNDDDFLDRDHDHDHDHEDDDSSVDLHPHSGDSLYDNQLDIGQADRAVHASKYVSLNSNSNNNNNNNNNNFNANANANTDTNHQQQIHNMQNTQPLAQPPNMFGDTGNLVYPQPKNKRASVINPSLLERLIRDSPAMSNKASSFVTRDNLRGSSHNLLLKYFVEDSEKNLNLPPQLNSYIIKSIEVDGRDDPDIFNYVKTFVFNKLENDHLPKFLDFTATRNINHSNFGRIITGFFFLFGAFWISFIFVFLNYRKGLRPVIVAPFFIAFYFIISSIYLVDPILAWLGLSETFSKSNGKSILRIEEKFIYKFIVKRSLWVMFLILVMTAIFTVLFSLVPGHRL